MNTLRASNQGGMDKEVTKGIMLSVCGSGHALSWHICQTEFGLSWETTEGSHYVVTAAEHQIIRKFDFAVVIFDSFGVGETELEKYRWELSISYLHKY